MSECRFILLCSSVPLLAFLFAHNCLRYVQDLAVSVAQRDKIIGLSSTKDASEGDEQEFRLQELVWRRLVLEEARQQVRWRAVVCFTNQAALRCVLLVKFTREHCLIAYMLFA